MSRICWSQRRRSSCAISAETSSDQRSAVLKLTTRTGSWYCPVSRSADDRFQVGLFGIGLPPDAALAPQIVHRPGRCSDRSPFGTIDGVHWPYALLELHPQNRDLSGRSPIRSMFGN